MLRIIDARTGEPVPAAPARRGFTRVEAHAPGRDTTGLRVLLVADVLVRTLELGGTPVWPLLTGEGDEARKELRADAAALGIRPFEESPGGPGRGQAIRVVRGDASASGGRVPGEGGAVRGDAVGAGGAGHGDASGVGDAGAAGDTAAGGGGPAGAASGREPLPDAATAPTLTVAPVDPAARDAVAGAGADVLRLALLERHRSTPVRLDTAALDEARATLTRLRRAVAVWARQPSRPVPGEVRDRLRAAWENDLDTPGLLRELRRVETDPDLADGARFETFAYADRLLGLDLTRDLGSPV
ncbi:hypothetical protein [Streptomyces sp. NPDC047725]|uniref:hypothetical protein n=1 Tax=Streptomyces sp. NPDC047725 TaxID=3365487 RepID=UPI0037102FF1